MIISVGSFHSPFIMIQSTKFIPMQPSQHVPQVEIITVYGVTGRVVAAGETLHA